MRRLVCLAALLGLGGLMPSARLHAQPKGGPLSPESALKALKVADGFQVELFAAEPMLINPTSIDVDHKGRVWVAEAVNYRRKNFGRPIIRKEGDRIQVLVDEKGAGKASKAVTFYQGPEIYGPLGVCVAPYADGKGQKVFVCQSPDILVFEDKDGDLKADGPPKKFLTGFGGFDHDHGVHGINIGPDGKLYFTVGDSGVTGLQSSDGKGRKWVSNTTDVQKGTVWRCDMDGTNVELIAHNFRNNYECCVDSFGEVWLSDNDDDGNQQTRICFVMPGGNYGYGPRGPGQTHWHEEQPGIVHKTLRTGFGSPTGITFYEGSLFPKKYMGALLHCDAGPREVRWFFRKPKGAGYELEKEVLLTSSDNWFRPSDACVAPDGSIFVADWYDRGVGGHGMGDPTDGRIYRITPKGHKGYKVPEVKRDTKGYAEALKSPCAAVRSMAFAHIRPIVLECAAALKEEAEKGAEAKPNQKAAMEQYVRILKELEDALAAQPEIAARMLWLTCVSNRGDWNPTPLFRVLGANRVFEGNKNGPLPPTLLRIDRSLGDNEIYRAARITLYPLETQPKTDLPKNSIDALNRDPGKFVAAYGPSPAARRELLLSMPGLGLEYVKPVFYPLAQKYDGSDHFYRAALNIACGIDPARRDKILADFDKHFPEWNDKVADLVWELRPKSVLPRLGKLLSDDKLTAAQKSRIVDIIASNDDLAAGRTMLAVLKGGAVAEVKARALASLRVFLPTKWKDLKESKELAQQIDEMLKEPKSQLTGLQLIAATGGANYARQVADIAKDTAAALDLRKEAVRTLGKIPSDTSVDALIDIGAPKNTLSTECVQALGQLLPQGRNVPAFATKAQGALQLALQLESATPEIKSAALSALAGNRAGTQWLLDAHQKGNLPKELVAQAGRLLRNSPFQGERNRALLLFPAPGKLNPKNLPAVAELARRAGDAARGKLVWNASLSGAAQCAKCHMVGGVGGQVGPDLSMIGKKASRENLYDSLLTPSKAIADQYLQHSVTTTAEVTVSGLLVADTPEGITLRDANGKDTTIPRKEIDGHVRKLKTSIMPEDIVAALNEDELVDLVAYLETLKTAALTPESFAVAGPFPAESMDKALDTEFGPEKGAFDPKAVWTMKGVTAIGWKTLRPDGKGYFDLAGMHGNAGTNSASYMYVEVESPVEQSAEILLGPDDGAKLWVNGKDVHTSRESRAATPAAHKIAVKLAKGKNAVLVKVANGNNPHGFYFSLTSAEEVKLVPRK